MMDDPIPVREYVRKRKYMEECVIVGEILGGFALGCLGAYCLGDGQGAASNLIRNLEWGSLGVGAGFVLDSVRRVCRDISFPEYFVRKRQQRQDSGLRKNLEP